MQPGKSSWQGQTDSSPHSYMDWPRLDIPCSSLAWSEGLPMGLGDPRPSFRRQGFWSSIFSGCWPSSVSSWFHWWTCETGPNWRLLEGPKTQWAGRLAGQFTNIEHEVANKTDSSSNHPLTPLQMRPTQLYILNVSSTRIGLQLYSMSSSLPARFWPMRWARIMIWVF